MGANSITYLSSRCSCLLDDLSYVSYVTHDCLQNLRNQSRWRSTVEVTSSWQITDLDLRSSSSTTRRFVLIVATGTLAFWFTYHFHWHPLASHVYAPPLIACSLPNTGQMVDVSGRARSWSRTVQFDLSSGGRTSGRNHCRRCAITGAEAIKIEAKSFGLPVHFHVRESPTLGFIYPLNYSFSTDVRFLTNLGSFFENCIYLPPLMATPPLRRTILTGMKT